MVLMNFELPEPSIVVSKQSQSVREKTNTIRMISSKIRSKKKSI